MRVEIKQSKLSLVPVIISLGLAIFGIVAASSFYAPIIPWFVVLFLLAVPRWEFKGSSVLALDFLLPVFAAIFTFYFAHFLNTYPYLERLNRHYFSTIYLHKGDSVYLTFLPLVIAFYFAFRLFTIPRKVSAALAPFVPMLMALVDYFVFTFRGQELVAADISGAGTAMNVASNYEFEIFDPLVFMIVPYLMFFIACLRIKEPKRIAPWYLTVVTNLLIAVTVSHTFFIGLSNYAKSNDIMIWSNEGSYYNSFTLSFLMSVKMLFPAKPEGYFGDEGFSNYATNHPYDYDSGEEEKANIIVIMSESYSDPDQYGYDLLMDPDPFWDNLELNAIHGEAASSVYGGRTPNSEYEFLTGITTSFLPAATIPYSMSINSETPSIVHFLNNNGYHTTAMHPYLSSGWNRTRVYPLLGFDEMYFVEDIDVTYDMKLRDYMSDLAAFNYLTDYLESLPDDEPTFTFMVTMQNHGGYTDYFENFPVNEYVTDCEEAYREKINYYFSLVSQSDIALEYLVNYLSEQDEKYVLLIYGDHQPSIPGLGYSMDRCGDASRIPYLLWTNYDMDEGLLNRTSPADSTGICYLGLDVLTAAGFELPAYYQYINEIRQIIPCINATGYYSVSRGEYIVVQDATDPLELAALNNYRYIQYNTLFDDADNDMMRYVLEQN